MSHTGAFQRRLGEHLEMGSIRRHLLDELRKHGAACTGIVHEYLHADPLAFPNRLPRLSPERIENDIFRLTDVDHKCRPIAQHFATYKACPLQKFLDLVTVSQQIMLRCHANAHSVVFHARHRPLQPFLKHTGIIKHGALRNVVETLAREGQCSSLDSSRQYDLPVGLGPRENGLAIEPPLLSAADIGPQRVLAIVNIRQRLLKGSP
jgi:hypothetical protein